MSKIIVSFAVLIGK